MGWKLATVISRLDGRTLQAFVDEVYGAPQTLKSSNIAALDALYPSDDQDQYALAHKGFGWIFDADLATRALHKALPVQAPLSVFLLHSVAGLYGFSAQANGAILRSRVGSGDDGIITDIGTPSDTEIALVCAGAEDGEAAWNAWCTGAETFSDGDDVLDVIPGEGVVFGLIDALTGIRIDSPTAEATTLHSAPVFEIVRERGLFALLFGRS